MGSRKYLIYIFKVKFTYFDIMRTRWNKNPVLAIVNNHLIDYPTAINTSYLYGFGSMAGLMLVVQILTGIFLAMH